MLFCSTLKQFFYTLENFTLMWPLHIPIPISWILWMTFSVISSIENTFFDGKAYTSENGCILIGQHIRNRIIKTITFVFRSLNRVVIRTNTTLQTMCGLGTHLYRNACNKCQPSTNIIIIDFPLCTFWIPFLTYCGACSVLIHANRTSKSIDSRLAHISSCSNNKVFQFAADSIHFSKSYISWCISSGKSEINRFSNDKHLKILQKSNANMKVMV